ncbi:MAG: STAS domain-containing protein [Gammaproteobacteria bacterium]
MSTRDTKIPLIPTWHRRANLAMVRDLHYVYERSLSPARRPMLRITHVATNQSATTLRVEGRIVDDWVPVLAEEIEAVLRTGKSAVLDFEAVDFVDRDGVKMLKETTADQLRIIHCSVFIEALLK